MTNATVILNDLHEAFTRYFDGHIIDLDKKLRHKFFFLIYKLENGKKFTSIPPHRTLHFCIQLVIKGSGKARVGNTCFPIGKNTLWFVPSGIVQSTSDLSKNITGFCLYFGIDLFLQQGFPRQYALDRIIFKTSVNPYIYITSHQEKRLKEVFECLHKEFNNFRKEKNTLITVKIIELLIYMDRIFLHQKALHDERTYHGTVEKFKELVEINFKKEHSVRYYADILSIHPNYLNNLVKKSGGITAKQTIQNRILLESKFLLHSTALSVKEIAYELGFGDPPGFYRFFTRSQQISPLAYRKQAV